MERFYDKVFGTFFNGVYNHTLLAHRRAHNYFRRWIFGHNLRKCF
ncbi:chemotaxis protein CheY [Listeria monocytogenes]|nr:chemotaxis protein CheY [Listeria monocytogenes]